MALEASGSTLAISRTLEPHVGEGSSQARRVLVEAAWACKRSPGPLRAFGQRVAARGGGNVATVAIARKLAVLCWQLLTRGEDDAYARPSLMRRKLRKLELRARAPAQRGKGNGPPEREGQRHLAYHPFRGAVWFLDVGLARDTLAPVETGRQCETQSFSRNAGRRRLRTRRMRGRRR